MAWHVDGSTFIQDVSSTTGLRYIIMANLLPKHADFHNFVMQRKVRCAEAITFVLFMTLAYSGPGLALRAGLLATSTSTIPLLAFLPLSTDSEVVQA